MNLPYKFIFLILLVFTCFIGCNKTFERKEQVLNYLKEVHNITLDKEFNIVIIISGHCGSCTEETFSLIRKFNEDARFTGHGKFIIIPKENFHIIEYLDNLKTDFHILKDKDIKLLRYGLLFPKNLLLEYENYERIRYWGWLYLDELYKINKKYFGNI